MAGLKQQIKEALLEGDFERVAAMAAGNKRVFGVLISLAYDKESLVTWRAIEAMGLAVGEIAETAPGRARDVIHRLLWSVTEESGSIGWSTPEMLAEIVAQGEGRFDDLPPIILSLEEEPPFVRGVLWAMGRLAEAGIRPPGAGDLVRASLRSENPQNRGLAVWAAGRMGLTDCLDDILLLSADQEVFSLYDGHRLSALRIGGVAREVYADLQVNYQAL